MNDLAAENTLLRHRIEELEFELAEIKGTGDCEVLLRICTALGVRPKAARYAMLLSDGKMHQYQQSLYALDAHETLGRSLNVYGTYLRRAGLEITCAQSIGHQMSDASCALVKKIMNGIAE